MGTYRNSHRWNFINNWCPSSKTWIKTGVKAARLLTISSLEDRFRIFKFFCYNPSSCSYRPSKDHLLMCFQCKKSRAHLKLDYSENLSLGITTCSHTCKCNAAACRLDVHCVVSSIFGCCVFLGWQSSCRTCFFFSPQVPNMWGQLTCSINIVCY